MALNQREKDFVYATVSIELVRMFDVLANSYSRPDETDEAKLIVEIEKSFRKDWEIFQLPVLVPTV